MASTEKDDPLLPFIRDASSVHCYDISTNQELLDYKNVNTMMIYTHALNKAGRNVRSPAGPSLINA